MYLSVWVQLLVTNPLHILQENLLAAAVIKFRGPAVGVAGDALSGLQSAVIFEKIRDACRPVIGGSCVSVADRDRKKTRRTFSGLTARRAR